jgi:hypothetical protein
MKLYEVKSGAVVALVFSSWMLDTSNSQHCLNTLSNPQYLVIHLVFSELFPSLYLVLIQWTVSRRVSSKLYSWAVFSELYPGLYFLSCILGCI